MDIMSNHKNQYTINKKGKVYEIYNTRNIFIKYLAFRLKNTIAAVLRSINAHKLNGIDIGTGEGFMLSYLVNRGVARNIIGIDLDSERINSAKKKFGHINFYVEDIYKF